jgi:nucleotide-binding universal stress UspA family protein
MKTIIIATDYSRPANKALEYGSEIARHTGARVILFNAFYIPAPARYTSYPSLPLMMPDVQELLTENKIRLSEIASALSNTYGIEVEAVTGTSSIFSELEELVDQHQADMVVMGMRGQSVEREFFGSNTLSVIRRAKFPVLAVPADAAYHNISKILFACDWTNLPLLNRLPVIKELALAFNASIQILHIEKEAVLATSDYSDEQDKVNVMSNIFDGVDYTYKEMKGRDVVWGIEKGIESYAADMLVMVPNRANFWDIVLSKSNTRNMAMRTQIPLLALPNPNL